MLPLDSFLVFVVSLLWHNNWIDFPSPLAYNLKFFFLFLSLDLVLLLNRPTFVFTSLLLLSALYGLPIAMIISVSGQLHIGLWLKPGPLHLLVLLFGAASLVFYVPLLILSVPISSSLSRLKSYLLLELKPTESASVWLMQWEALQCI